MRVCVPKLASNQHINIVLVKCKAIIPNAAINWDVFISCMKSYRDARVRITRDSIAARIATGTAIRFGSETMLRAIRTAERLGPKE